MFRQERSAASSRRSPESSERSPSGHRGEVESADTGPVVLIVDDTEDTRLLYVEAFADAGYRVEQATNGQEALDIIAQTKPALVLMDLSMPVMDGWEATKRIKGHPTTADVVVIALTGHATHLGMQRAIDAGAEAVLAKPCLPDDVLARARSLLGDS